MIFFLTISNWFLKYYCIFKLLVKNCSDLYIIINIISIYPFFFFFFLNNSSWLSEGNRLRIPLNNGQSQSLTFVQENKQILRLVVKGLQFIDLLVAGKRLCVWNTNSKRVPGAEERWQRCFQELCIKTSQLDAVVRGRGRGLHPRHNKPADDTRNHHLKWWWWGVGGISAHCCCEPEGRPSWHFFSSAVFCFSPRLPS